MDDELNREFRRLLGLSGWTQAKAAEELSVDVGTVNRYVAGTVKPSRTVLKLLASLRGERLKLPGEQLHYRAEDGPQSLEPSEREFLNTIQRFHPTQRREILRGLGAALAAIAQPVTYAEPSSAEPPPGKPTASGKVDKRKIERLAKAAVDHILGPEKEGRAA